MAGPTKTRKARSGAEAKLEQEVSAMGPAPTVDNTLVLGRSARRVDDDDDVDGVEVDSFSPVLVPGGEIDEDRYAVQCAQGAFSVIPPGYTTFPSGSQEYDSGLTLEFGESHQVWLEPEHVQWVKDLLAGTLDHPRVDPRVRRELPKLAEQAGLRLIRPGLVAAPIATWDKIPDAEVVQTAINMDQLGSIPAVENALRHELQAPKRENAAREPRPIVVRDLNRLLEDMNGEGADAVDDGTVVL